MILKIKRTVYSGKKEEYDILDKNNKLVLNCYLNNEEEFNKVNLRYNNETFLLNIPKSYSNISTIIKKDLEIGKIESNNDGKIVSNNYYWNISFDTRNFKLYEVGLGSKGLYLVVKEEEKTIAIISSSLVVKNFKDSYELFIEDEKDAVVAILGCIYWNLYRGTNFVKEGISASGTINKVLNTTSKEIINKMDYAFIDKISKEENYKPNNESKKSTTYQIIGWTLFIAFIIFLAVILVVNNNKTNKNDEDIKIEDKNDNLEDFENENKDSQVDWSNLEVSINGKQYKYPYKVSDFINNGWLAETSEDQLELNKQVGEIDEEIIKYYESTGVAKDDIELGYKSVSLTQDNMTIILYADNKITDIKVADANIVRLEISQSESNTKNNFNFYGINFDTKKEQIENLFGTKNYEVLEDDTNYTYRYFNRLENNLTATLELQVNIEKDKLDKFIISLY